MALTRYLLPQKFRHRGIHNIFWCLKKMLWGSENEYICQFPWTQDVNWMHINLIYFFWMSCLRSIYVLCPEGILVAVFFFSFISGVMDVTFVFDDRIQWRYITTLLLKNFQFSQFKCSFNGVLFCIYYNCKYKSCFARSSKSRKTSQIFFNSYEA